MGKSQEKIWATGSQCGKWPLVVHMSLRLYSITLQKGVHWQCLPQHHLAAQKALVCGGLDYAGQLVPHLLTSGLAVVLAMPSSTSQTHT